MGRQFQNVHKTRDNLRDDPELIWEFEQLILATQEHLAIDGNAMLSAIVQDKIDWEDTKALIFNIGLATAAIVAGLLSAGVGTAFVAGIVGTTASTVTATATVGGLALTGVDLYNTIKDYQVTHAANDINAKFDAISGFTNEDPSLFWVGVAVVAAGLDLIGITQVFKALKGPAKALAEAGDTAAETKALQKIDNSLDDLVEEGAISQKNADEISQLASSSKKPKGVGIEDAVHAGHSELYQSFSNTLKKSYDELVAKGLDVHVEGGIIKFSDDTGKVFAEISNGKLIFKYSGFGGDLVMVEGKTTAVFGRFKDPIHGSGTIEFIDTATPLYKGAENPNGLNILNIEEWTWAQNRSWVIESAERGDIIRFISDPTNPANIFKNGVNGKKTVTGLEVETLEELGFIWDASKFQFIKP